MIFELGRFKDILLYSVLATMLTACDGERLVMDVSAPDSQAAIGFDGGFVDAMTRGAGSLSLDVFARSMEVWGWRSDDTGSAVEKLFDGQKVTFDTVQGMWTYSPIKYWDGNSTYRFAAIAPYADRSVNRVTVDSLTSFVKIDSVMTDGTNLQDSATNAERLSFLGTTQKDWLVARAGQTAAGSARDAVNFTMQHILSKLNVRVKLSQDMISSPGLDSVKVSMFSVGKFMATANFEQKLAATPSPQQASVQEWTQNASALDSITLSGMQDSVKLSADWMYVQESLLIPQKFLSSQDMKLRYTIFSTGGVSESFTFTIDLASLFSQFSIDRLSTGYNYTISLVIDVDSIQFDAGMDAWTKVDEAVVTI